MSDSLRPHGLWLTTSLCPWDSPGKNTGVSCHTLLQWIFLTQELNLHLLCLLHWQACLLPLAPLGKPSYIFTTNLCGNDSKTWFKDENTEVLKLSNDIKAPQSFEAEYEYNCWVMLTLGLHKHSTPGCLWNDFLGSFAHCKFSTDTLSFINQYCTLETKAYIEESTCIQSLGLFSKDALWSVYIEHAQRKGGNQQNRTEPNHVDAKVCLVFAQMCFQTLLAEPRIF